MLKHSRHSLLLVLLLLPLSSGIHAEDGVGIIGEVSTSNKNIDFLTTDGDTGNKVTFAANILTLDYAATAVYRDFYGRLKLSQTIMDDKVLSGSLVTNTRTDADLTLGYYLGSGISMFMGQKTGSFEASIINISGPPFKAVFKDDGIFLGLSYSLPLEKGSIALTVAYADMDGEIAISSATASQLTTGNTTGFSYSLSWSTPVSDATNFSFSLNSTRYDFDDTQDGIGGLDFSTEQSFDSVSVGLLHYF